MFLKVTEEVSDLGLWAGCTNPQSVAWIILSRGRQNQAAGTSKNIINYVFIICILLMKASGLSEEKGTIHYSQIQAKEHGLGFRLTRIASWVG